MHKEKKDLPILLRLVQPIQENGFKVSEMVMVCKYGQMERVMKVNGKTTELMVMESSFMLMVMFMKEIGSMIKLMDSVFISM